MGLFSKHLGLKKKVLKEGKRHWRRKTRARLRPFNKTQELLGGKRYSMKHGRFVEPGEFAKQPTPYSRPRYGVNVLRERGPARTRTRSGAGNLRAAARKAAGNYRRGG